MLNAGMTSNLITSMGEPFSRFCIWILKPAAVLKVVDTVLICHCSSDVLFVNMCMVAGRDEPVCILPMQGSNMQSPQINGTAVTNSPVVHYPNTAVTQTCEPQ